MPYAWWLCYAITIARRNGMTPQCRRPRLPLSVLTFPPSGRAGAVLAGGIERARARPRPQMCDARGWIACHRCQWARLARAVSTLAYAQRMPGLGTCAAAVGGAKSSRALSDSGTALSVCRRATTDVRTGMGGRFARRWVSGTAEPANAAGESHRLCRAATFTGASVGECMRNRHDGTPRAQGS